MQKRCALQDAVASYSLRVSLNLTPQAGPPRQLGALTALVAFLLPRKTLQA
jgi:hypothetical protein